jgi:hypothetical protein
MCIPMTTDGYISPRGYRDARHRRQLIDAAQLELGEARSFKNGLVWLTYHRQ